MTKKQSYIGEFEHHILLCLAQHRGTSYGTEIRATLMRMINRDTSIGALYATLERLQKKGFVSSKVGEPTAERGGRAKRYFELTAQGRQVLLSTKHNLETLWAGVEL